MSENICATARFISNCWTSFFCPLPNERLVDLKLALQCEYFVSSEELPKPKPACIVSSKKENLISKCTNHPKPSSLLFMLEKKENTNKIGETNVLRKFKTETNLAKQFEISENQAMHSLKFTNSFFQSNQKCENTMNHNHDDREQKNFLNTEMASNRSLILINDEINSLDSTREPQKPNIERLQLELLSPEPLIKARKTKTKTMDSSSFRSSSSPDTGYSDSFPTWLRLLPSEETDHLLQLPSNCHRNTGCNFLKLFQILTKNLINFLNHSENSFLTNKICLMFCWCFI